MDFFNMDFSKLFLDKHGEVVYNKIIDEIIKEDANKIDNTSIEIIFKVAFFSFFGLKNTEIKYLIEDFMQVQNVNIKGIKNKHKNSIKEINKCLKEVMDKRRNIKVN